MSEDDYWRMRERGINSSQQVTELPDKFREYVNSNQQKIKEALSRGTAPYWLRDNMAKVSPLMRSKAKS